MISGVATSFISERKSYPSRRNIVYEKKKISIGRDNQGTINYMISSSIIIFTVVLVHYNSELHYNR